MQQLLKTIEQLKQQARLCELTAKDARTLLQIAITLTEIAGEVIADDEDDFGSLEYLDLDVMQAPIVEFLANTEGL